MVDILNPTVLRFARLLPMTFRPWLFVASPDSPVENVVRLIAAVAPFQNRPNIDEFFKARKLRELRYEFRSILRVERVLTFKLRDEQL